MDTISQLVYQGIHGQALVDKLLELPELRQLAEINATEEKIKSSLLDRSEALHLSMQSHFRMGTSVNIGTELQWIEGYLQQQARESLPATKRFFLSLKEFFITPPGSEDLELHLRTLEEARQHLMIYTGMLSLKMGDFESDLDVYTRWIQSLNLLASIWLGENDSLTKGQELIQHTARGTELLSAQLQLKTTVRLQRDSNQRMIDDIDHLLHISRSLASNHLTVKEFMDQHYRNSMERIGKYR
ncbi:MAG: hypothetical protein EOP49_03945 [Sphingobacteriales bacterium]|nr:MAG: hypothetical protein EOP49_03945 [Sphingobacteriales bacterium]